MTLPAMPDGLQRWHHIVEARDASGLDALLADAVVFHSPVVHTPQVGKAITRKYLEAALLVLNTPDFVYRKSASEGDVTVLEFETRIDGIVINGVDIIRWSADGRQIVDFKVMVRPLKAINALQQAMGRVLAGA